MGTRADFYVGRGAEAEWLGSIAWDGYPDGVNDVVLEARSVESYRKAVADFLGDRADATLPEQGWPWPWENSHTTDYSYAFDEGEVWGTCFGHGWWKATHEPDKMPDEKTCVFPDMTSRQKVTLGKRSGVMIFGSGR